jgi:hypothetical protein
MPLTPIVLAVVASTITSSMTDWLFMGDWLYKRYDKHPEIWRHHRGEGETKAIIWASLLPLLTCSFLVFVCARLGLSQYGAALKLAGAIWLIGPLPLIVANSLFLKITPVIAASHALGWLVKLLVTGLAVAVFMHR